MSRCFQLQTDTASQTVLGHGEAVWQKYKELLLASEQGVLPPDWRLPKWWGSEIAQQLAAAQPTLETMERYLVYHDCGKPYCRTIDEQGWAHFPGHAEHSAALWARLGGTQEECWLMRHDMVLHSGAAEECDALVGSPLLAGLLLAALAELHSNAELFGGSDSTSFKIKLKAYGRKAGRLLRR